MRVMTTAEAGAALRVSERTVERLIAAGTLAARNVGSPKRPRLRVTDQDLEAYLAGQRISPVPARRAS